MDVEKSNLNWLDLRPKVFMSNYASPCSLSGGGLFKPLLEKKYSYITTRSSDFTKT